MERARGYQQTQHTRLRVHESGGAWLYTWAMFGARPSDKQGTDKRQQQKKKKNEDGVWRSCKMSTPRR